MNIHFSPLSPQNRVTPVTPTAPAGQVEGVKNATEESKPPRRTFRVQRPFLGWILLAIECAALLDGRGPWGLSFEELHSDRAILQELRGLVSLLFTMTRRDCSDESVFLQKFSSKWKALQQLEHLATEQGHLLAAGLVVRVENLLSSYPPGEDFNLVYYLGLAAGEEWFPVPFLLLVRELHLESREEPKHAHLHLWIRALCNLLRAWHSDTVVEHTIEACLQH